LNKDKPKGLFIVIEGPHGVGKTTSAKELVHLLKDKALEARYTKEPFSPRLKKEITVLATKNHSNPVALACLIAADRYIHLEQIEAWLSTGTIVVCDRYKLSSVVYQQIDGVSMSFIDKVNSLSREPDLTFLLRAPLSVRRKRFKERIRKDAQHIFFLEKAFRAEQVIYDNLSKTTQDNVEVIDGTEPIRTVVGKMMKKMEPVLSK
jgi:dTMP kinase